MYGAWLYRLNYEEYKNKEKEIDEKLKKLFEENEDDEDIEPLDEAYIIRFDTENNEDFSVQDSGYFVLLVGDSNYDYEYADNVIYGLSERYSEYIELKNNDIEAMDSATLDKFYELDSYFTPYEDEDVNEITEGLFSGECDHGEVIKTIFKI